MTNGVAQAIIGTQEQVTLANSQIGTNCGFPNGHGTDMWDQPEAANGQTFYFIMAPDPSGWSDGVQSFTYDQMMNNVVNVTLQDYDQSWNNTSS